MSNFAPVAPAETFLDLYEMAEYRPKYVLLLAHDVVEDQANWRAVREHGILDDAFIIMDNSLIELGEPVDSGTMDYACSLIKPDVVVLPDKLHDPYWTIQQSRKAAIEWSTLKHVQGRGFLGVVQGDSMHDLRTCAWELIAVPGLTHLSVPRVVGQTLGSRLPFIKELQGILRTGKPGLEDKIHLLGFSDNLLDDIECVRMPGVMGIDSAVPLRLGLQGHLMVDDPLKDPGPRGNYWEEIRMGINLKVIENVEWITKEVQRVI